jgi:hypothetical protein
MPRLRASRLLLLASSCLAWQTTPSNAQWSPQGIPLAPTLFGSQYGIAMVPDGAGGAIVAWADARNYDRSDPNDPNPNYSDIYAQRVTASGEIAAGWPVDGMPIVLAPSSQHTQAIVADGSGGAYIAWLDFRDAQRTRFVHVYLQRIREDGTIAPDWPLNGVPVCPVPGYQKWPSLAPDGSGGVYVVWNDNRTAPVPWEDEPVHVYAQRITPDGKVAPGWPTEGLPVCTAPGTRRVHHVLADGRDGVFIAWTDGRDLGTTRADIYAVRLTSDGAVAPGWTPGGTPVCVEPDFQSIWNYGTALVPDREDGFYVGWIHGFDIEARDIYVQRVTGSGEIAAGWPAKGMPVCTAPWEQQAFDMEPDGFGGVLFAWSDYRNQFVSAADLYAQRILPSGEIAPGWSIDGNLMSGAPGWQEAVSTVATDDGGALFSFQNAFGYQVYAQRATRRGEIASGWPPGGVLLAPLSPRSQFGPTAVSDGAGGMIVAWEDSRDGRDRIYAQWVSGSRPTPSTPIVTGTKRSRLVSWTLSEALPGSTWLVLRARKHGSYEEVAAVVADSGAALSWEDHSRAHGELRYRIRREVINSQYRTESGDGIWRPGRLDGSDKYDQGSEHKDLALRLSGNAGELELSGGAAGPIQVRVYDVQGRLVYARRESVSGRDALRLNLVSELRANGAGIYFATAQDAEGRATPPLRFAVLR